MNRKIDNITEFGEWFEYKFPFKHFRANNVLSPDSYSNIQDVFLKMFETAYNNKNIDKSIKKNQNYDALIHEVNNKNAPQFYPFFNEEWLKSLSKFLSIPFINKVDGALHCNLKNSKSGWIHSDFCSGWFDENTKQNKVSFPDRKNCDYYTGQVYNSQSKPVEYIRAATLIYYLCNDEWKGGEGGETGLYDSQKLSNNTYCDFVKPINNTLLLFECSPHSYHRFITNPGRTRNSIILWLHTTIDQASFNWNNLVNHNSKI